MNKVILLLNGPNLNMLGSREKAHYGDFTLSDVESNVRELAKAHGYALEAFQSNYEGALIERIHMAVPRVSGILINAGALTHYSYALLDALLLCSFPIVEVHISDIHRREPFRQVSVIRAACVDQVAGLGFDSYRVGLERLFEHIGGRGGAKMEAKVVEKGNG